MPVSGSTAGAGVPSSSSSSMTPSLSHVSHVSQVSSVSSASSSLTSSDSKGAPKVSIVDKELTKGKKEVALASFSYLFCELVQYTMVRTETETEIEKRLSDAGYGIGLRVLELLSHREKACRREKNLIAMLQFIHTVVWKSLFGRVSDGLEKSRERDDEYYLYDKEPITNKFVSVPKRAGVQSDLNVAAFIAGIVNGVLDAAEFTSEVAAHYNADRSRTVYVIKIAKEVMARPET